MVGLGTSLLVLAAIPIPDLGITRILGLDRAVLGVLVVRALDRILEASEAIIAVSVLAVLAVLATVRGVDSDRVRVHLEEIRTPLGQAVRVHLVPVALLGVSGRVTRAVLGRVTQAVSAALLEGLGRPILGSAPITLEASEATRAVSGLQVSVRTTPVGLGTGAGLALPPIRVGLGRVRVDLGPAIRVGLGRVRVDLGPAIRVASDLVTRVALGPAILAALVLPREALAATRVGSALQASAPTTQPEDSAPTTQPGDLVLQASGVITAQLEDSVLTTTLAALVLLLGSALTTQLAASALQASGLTKPALEQATASARTIRASAPPPTASARTTTASARTTTASAPPPTHLSASTTRTRTGIPFSRAGSIRSPTWSQRTHMPIFSNWVHRSPNWRERSSWRRDFRGESTLRRRRPRIPSHPTSSRRSPSTLSLR